MAVKPAARFNGLATQLDSLDLETRRVAEEWSPVPRDGTIGNINAGLRNPLMLKSAGL